MARRRMSNAALAELLGVDAMWVWRRAHGTTRITLGDLERIAAALDLTPSAFMPAIERAS